MLVPLSQAYVSGKPVSIGLWAMGRIRMGCCNDMAVPQGHRDFQDDSSTFDSVTRAKSSRAGTEPAHAERIPCSHDFPANQFNVDHVVIGPTGVFAVETKARSKPVNGGGKQDATVVCHGDHLAFPNGSDYASVEAGAAAGQLDVQMADKCRR